MKKIIDNDDYMDKVYNLQNAGTCSEDLAADIEEELTGLTKDQIKFLLFHLIQEYVLDENEHERMFRLRVKQHQQKEEVLIAQNQELGRKLSDAVKRAQNLTYLEQQNQELREIIAIQAKYIAGDI